MSEPNHIISRAEYLRSMVGFISEAVATKGVRVCIEGTLIHPERTAVRAKVRDSERFKRAVTAPAGVVLEALEDATVIGLLGPRVLATYRQRAEALVVAHLPATITVEGVDFHRGTKLGTDRLTGLPSVEYVDAGDRRCWVQADGVAGEVDG